MRFAAPAAAQNAEALYQSACDSGDFDACIVFGQMLESGEGIPRDAERAAGLFAIACEGGDPEGCARLGLLHELGTGVEIDLVRARFLYRTACGARNRLGCDQMAALTVVHPELSETLFARMLLVEDATTQERLDAALIEVPELGIYASTDSVGAAVLWDLPEGRCEVTASRVGYEPIEGILSVPDDAAALVPLTPIDVVAPDAPGEIRGRILGDSLEPLGLVQVALTGPAERDGVTGPDGRFVFYDVPPGVAEITFTKLGYGARRAELVLQPGSTTEFEVSLSTRVIDLAPIEVVADRRSIDISNYLDRNGFTRREARGFGRQYDREYIEDRNPMYVYDVVRGVPGVRLDLDVQTMQAFAWNPRVRSLNPSDPTCWLEIFIDGVRSLERDLNQISPYSLDAIEVYVGSDTPVEYSFGNPCGAVLLWTRR